MRNIIVEASDVWDYFQKHLEEIKRKPKVIAEHAEYGVDIVLMEENCLPYFVVNADDYQYDEERATSKIDCTSTVSELYDTYLTERFFDEMCDTQIDQEDMISERELELDEAIMHLLDVVLEEDSSLVLDGDVDFIAEDVKDHIMEYLSRKHELSVRRPMVLEDDETGEDFFVEYPYECMVFDDDDNSIYKK